MIIRFLEKNSISTSYLNRYSDGKTTIALAFLDKQADAGYSFYTDLPKEILSGKLPVPASNDMVLFGSFFSLADDIQEKLKTFLTSASQNGAMILYDPNFRRPHLKELPRVMPQHYGEYFHCGYHPGIR